MVRKLQGERGNKGGEKGRVGDTQAGRAEKKTKGVDESGG